MHRERLEMKVVIIQTRKVLSDLSVLHMYIEKPRAIVCLTGDAV